MPLAVSQSIPMTHLKVVLVRPHFAGNLGAVARVMCNFGASRLTLVTPFADPLSEEARRLATHGAHLLESATIVETLDEAVADCGVVFGTSSNVEGLFREQHHGRPDEMLASLVEPMAGGPCALVFGPEPHGLSNADVARCHGLIRVPTVHDCPSLNLAQSVAICLYELRQQTLRAEGRVGQSPNKIAPFADQERMFESLKEGLKGVHFLFGQKAEPLMHAMRQLIVRARPTPNEVRILFGLARQLRWVAEHGPNSGPSRE